jgi:hypothetical protein
MEKNDYRVKNVVRDVFNNDDTTVRDKVACWGLRKTFFRFESVNEAREPLEGVLGSVFYVPACKLAHSEDPRPEGLPMPTYEQGMVIAQNSPQAWDHDFYDVGDVLKQLRQDDAEALVREANLLAQLPSLTSLSDLHDTYQSLADIQQHKMHFLK